jgi:hypothetical protein
MIFFKQSPKEKKEKIVEIEELPKTPNVEEVKLDQALENK